MSTRSITHAVDLTAPPETVYSWLTTPSAICRWWNASRAMVIAEPGGYWMAAWGDAMDAPQYLMAARIEAYEPPRRLRLGQSRYAAASGSSGDPFETTMEFTLEPAGTGTRLTVVQDGFPTDSAADPIYAGCVQGWQDTFANIARFAAVRTALDVRPPVRVTHRYVQTLDGTAAEVLPLLCPVRETEWVPGWAPRLVLSDSGVAERDCVFLTPDPAAGPGAEAVWTVLSLDPDAGTVEMLKVTPGFLVVRLAVALRPGDGGGCLADVTYRYTALGPSGEEYVRMRTPEAYEEFMRDWETALNRHLRLRRSLAAGEDAALSGLCADGRAEARG